MGPQISDKPTVEGALSQTPSKVSLLILKKEKELANESLQNGGYVKQDRGKNSPCGENRRRFRSPIRASKAKRHGWNRSASKPRTPSEEWGDPDEKEKLFIPRSRSKSPSSLRSTVKYNVTPGSPLIERSNERSLLKGSNKLSPTTATNRPTTSGSEPFVEELKYSVRHQSRGPAVPNDQESKWAMKSTPVSRSLTTHTCKIEIHSPPEDNVPIYHGERIQKWDINEETLKSIIRDDSSSKSDWEDVDSLHEDDLEAIEKIPPKIEDKKPHVDNPSVFTYVRDCASRSDISKSGIQEVDDLIHLSGPLTEDAVLKSLNARFLSQSFYTNVGPILLSVNPYQAVGNALTLDSTKSAPPSDHLRRVVNEAVRQQSETGYPQAIILSGACGSGKTYTSMLLLRQLFNVAGGGPETDAFKHLAAAFTVLRSLGSAKTAANSESSRIGQFIEVQVTDGALYRTKIHCYFLNQTRVVKPTKDEKNYHIFYQMLAGLTKEERVKLHLDGHGLRTLRYLSEGDTSQDEARDAKRFATWKSCLSVLGIPFLDVVRVLASVLLLGNVSFVEGKGVEVDIKGGSIELKNVASLLGVSSVALYRGLTTRTHNVRGQLVKSMCDVNMSNMTRDALAKALYCRTVATIVRRANSLKRLGSTSGTLSSDSNESVHQHADVASQHASTTGTAGSKASKSMSVLNSAVKHATDGFIGILDMFGFEDPKPASLEHLCINLCAETMQHFYNSHIFKSSIESCREEGILCEVEVDYVNNVPCIDLISSLRTGLLSILDVECSERSTPENYIQKVKVQHKGNSRLYEHKSNIARAFGIHHFANDVVYDVSNFLDTNKDVISDDLVSVFQKPDCNFGFATHIFGSELKALSSQEPVPRGVSFRISPTSHTDLQKGDEPVSTLTQDFHTRLDNLLRTLVHAKPHFVRCIRANSTEKPLSFDRATVIKQIRALQVLETVNLMAGGFPHRMRFKSFSIRYRLLAPSKRMKRTEDKTLEDCKVILDCFVKKLEDCNKTSNISIQWALGKRHIFLSEGARQKLEVFRIQTNHRAATIIQAVWRGWRLCRRWPTLRMNLEQRIRTKVALRPRPQPITGTPPPDALDRCSQKTIQQTCSFFGLDLERPPPVPPSRSYTIAGAQKVGYPQSRQMKMTYPEDPGAEIILRKGQTVSVVGASQRRGHLLVEFQGHTLNVPYQYLELKSSSPAVNI